MGYAFLVAAKAKWLAGFLAVVGLSMFLPRAFAQPLEAYALNVPLDTAAGLYAGSDVEIAGAKAGHVDSISLAGDTAMVRIVVDPQHSPVGRDATVQLRPKSLLGEKYLALDPGGAADTLPSGATIPRAQVTRSTDLEEVFNTFDAPTRARLQIVIDEVGGGVAGVGDVQNRGIRTGAQDLNDLSALADTLARRDADLREVINSLSIVTDELSRSDRSAQLGDLIKNTEDLMRSLADQDVQLKRALVSTNAALGRTSTALDGTGGNLNNINNSLSTTTSLAGELTGDLGNGMDTLLPNLSTFIKGVQEGPVVFGGRDANGFATRISVVAGTATLGVPNPPGLGSTSTGPQGASGAPANPASAIPGAGSGAGVGTVVGFLLGGAQP